jgi:hypothetical protein
MGKSLPIEEKKDNIVLTVKTNLTGDLKREFLKDVEKGEMPSHLLRQMAREFYKNRKNGY